MAVYFITGKLGSGKSLASVGRIRDYLKQGRRVATNLDLNLDKMLPPSSRAVVTRIPDKPRIEDFESIGFGADSGSYDESNFGLLVLDELGSWFNSRGWNDKSRHDVIEWFLHARKLRWDILFIVQSIDIIDKQLRETLCEHLVVCRRLDRLTVPFISPVFKMIFGRTLNLPKIHVGTVYYGDSEVSLKVDRWWYSARDLYKAYDTAQCFTSGQELIKGEFVDMRSTYSVLSSWHVYGRYKLPFDWRKLLTKICFFPVSLFVAFLAMLSGCSPDCMAIKLHLRPRKPEHGRSRLSRNQSGAFSILSGHDVGN